MSDIAGAMIVLGLIAACVVLCIFGNGGALFAGLGAYWVIAAWNWSNDA